MNASYEQINSIRNYLCLRVQKGNQEFATEKQEKGLGDGSSPVGSRGRAPVEVWGKAPRSWRQIWMYTLQKRN